MLVNDKGAVIVNTPVTKEVEMEAKEEPLTQSVRQAAKELGIGVNQAYEAVRRGDPEHQNREANSVLTRAAEADVRRRVMTPDKEEYIRRSEERRRQRIEREEAVSKAAAEMWSRMDQRQVRATD